jgi:hypothetical protein
VTSALPARPLPSSHRPGWRLLALTTGVLALHGLLLQGTWRWSGTPAAWAAGWPAAQSSQPVTVLAIAPAAPAPRPVQQVAAVNRAARPRPADTAAAMTAPPAAALPAPEAPEAPDPPGGTLPSTDAPTQTPRAAPPLPAPRLPQPVTLDYLAQRGSLRGEATLDWAPSPDGPYQLSLRLALAGRPESAWVSVGQTGPQGLAPDRMVEERRQRPIKAINFQRDKGLISFSSSTATVALQPGGQDRISWLVQLSGLAQALDDRLDLDTELSLQVATVGGLAETWTFRVEAAEAWQPEGQPEQPAWRLVREPQRPYDQRVEVWLARGNGLLPLQLRLTPVPAGEPLLLWLRHPLGERAGS